MDKNNSNSGSQRTKKFDAVGSSESFYNQDNDGVYISERPVYNAGQQRRPRQPQNRTAAAQNTKKNNAPKKKKESAKNTAVKNKKSKQKKVLTEQEIKKRQRRKGMAFAFFSVVTSISIILSVFLISCMNDILAMNRSKDKISVSVNNSMSTNQVIDELGKSGLIKNPWFCKLAAKILKYDNEEYLTSVYFLQPSYGLEKMLDTMSSNSTGTETVKLIFPEGYSIEQIFEKLDKFEVCSIESLRATARQMDFSDDFPFLKSIPNKTERYYYLEGYLYPDTYEFYVGENATSVISRFLQNYQKHWTEDYQEQADSLGMSMDDVLRLASIIEKEAYGKDQMYLISSVLHNRLADNSGAFSYLQCDSTGSYISGIPETVLAGNDRVAFTKLFDTYQTVGLPAGPICSPGNDAIKAALNPDDTAYFYFRHDVNKKIYMAETKREHDRNGEEVLRVNSQSTDE